MVDPDYGVVQHWRFPHTWTIALTLIAAASGTAIA
jgi:hypothetical protein